MEREKEKERERPRIQDTGEEEFDKKKGKEKGVRRLKIFPQANDKRLSRWYILYST